jgi:ATP-binding cassette, subfamily B, multidrug efflux pump
VGGTLLSEGPRVLKRWWLMTANARIRTNIRADAVRGILAMPLADLHEKPIGDLMARIIGDVEVLGVGVREFIIETWDTLLFSISLIVAMLFYDASLTILVLLPTPLALLLSYASGRWVSARTRASREANADLTALLQEQLAGLRVLRLFGRSDAAVADMATLSQAQARANLRIVGLRSSLQPLYSMLITAGVVLLIWQGGLRVAAGAMSVGTFVAYLQLYGRFVGRGFRIPQLVNSPMRGSARCSRPRCQFTASRPGPRFGRATSRASASRPPSRRRVGVARYLWPCAT